MQKWLIRSFAAIALGTTFLAPDALALDGGPGSGATCYTCNCWILGAFGAHQCGCPTGGGGAGCIMTYDPMVGTSCDVMDGPCYPAVGGIAP